MKKKILRNLPFKLLSLLIAVFVWIIVTNIEDPISTKTFDNIPVNVVNDEVADNDKTAYNVEGDGYLVSVDVKARKSVLDAIRDKNIIAYADFNDIMLEKLVPIRIRILKYEGQYESATALPNNLKIKIEKKVSIKLPITVVQKGTPKDGFFVSSALTSPENITIEGPKSRVDRVDKAVVEVDVDNISRDKSITKNLKLYDKNGDEIESEIFSLTGTDGKINVALTIKPAKSVPIRVTTSGTPQAGYKVKEIVCKPEKISIVGEEEILDSISEISIPASEINVGDTKKSVEKTIDITPYLPSGVSLADTQGNKILVTINIEKEG